MMRTLDADRWQILRRVEMPSALPYLFSGAKIAAAVAVIGAVFGEWSGADEGLGHLILIAQAPASDRARVRRGRRALGDRDRAVRRCSRWSSAASRGGPRDERPDGQERR